MFKKNIFSVIALFMTLGSTDAQTYNGPLTPSPYTGYSIYYYFGAYNDFVSGLKMGSLTGVPDRYKYMPWYGNGVTALQYATDWINPEATYGGGVRYPGAYGMVSPIFAYYYDSGTQRGVAVEAVKDSPPPFSIYFDGTSPDYWAVAVSD